jgi:transposase
MGIGRYELSDAQWTRIEGLLPGRADTVGRTAANNRMFINGVLWVLRSGAHWHDLPERYGKYKSVHKRFSRWAASGVWSKVFGDLVADRKNPYLMIDSTIVRAHLQAATGRKKGARTRLWSRLHRLQNQCGFSRSRKRCYKIVSRIKIHQRAPLRQTTNATTAYVYAQRRTLAYGASQAILSSFGFVAGPARRRLRQRQ